jgi:hypothetical protein
VKQRLPIVAHYATALSADDQEGISALAARILDEEPGLSMLPPLSPHLEVGMVDVPSFVIEDHSGILLAHENGADMSLSYRALLLAGEGDLVAVYGQRSPAFEAYCREKLGLGRVEVLAPKVADPDQSLSIACVSDRDFIGRAATIAREAGGLNVIPYMGTGGVWRLAGEIAAEAQVPVRVAAAPPKLVRAVNDKLWFARRAAELLGTGAVPHSHTVYGMAALVGHFHRFARQHDRIALKLSNSAASLGNLVLDSGPFAGLSPAETAEQLGALMRQRRWRESFPLQLTAWEAPLIGSPSAQLWIPMRNEGAPIVEGIFDQLVSGPGARFVGAVPSRLSLEWRQRIADEAARLGALFQALGYFGRCSFDAVLVEHPDEPSQLHWVECNGRWGGVSIPMTLTNRLLGDWETSGLLIVDRQYENLRVSTAAEFLDRFVDSLFTVDGTPEGAILLSPGRIEQGAIEILFLGCDESHALARSETLLATLAG